jgi:hypothetical protein
MQETTRVSVNPRAARYVSGIPIVRRYYKERPGGIAR